MLGRMANHPSVLELDRCLTVLRDTDGVAFRHVKAYRVGVEWRNVTRWVRTRRLRGKGFELVERRVKEPIVPSWVSREAVQRGEDRLVSEFQGEVYLPDELWDAWHKPIAA